MKITTMGEKGGGGKSMLACHLAAWWSGAGYRVLLFDSDPQGTAMAWADARAKTLGDEAPGPNVIPVQKGETLRRQVLRHSEGYDVTIIDTPGRAGMNSMGALLVSHVALVPVKPAGADIWELPATLELIEQAREGNEDLRTALVLNEFDNRTKLTRDTRIALPNFGPVLPVEIGDRAEFNNAFFKGLGVHERPIRNRDNEAVDQLSRLAHVLITEATANAA